MELAKSYWSLRTCSDNGFSDVDFQRILDADLIHLAADFAMFLKWISPISSAVRCGIYADFTSFFFHIVNMESVAEKKIKFPIQRSADPA